MLAADLQFPLATVCSFKLTMTDCPLERYHPLVPPYDIEDKITARRCFFYLFGLAGLCPSMKRHEFWNMLGYSWKRVECWVNYFSFYLTAEGDDDIPSQKVGDVMRTLISRLITRIAFMEAMITDPIAVSRATKYWLYKGKADVTPVLVADMMSGALDSASTEPTRNALADMLEAAGMDSRRIARTALHNINKVVWELDNPTEEALPHLSVLKSIAKWQDAIQDKHPGKRHAIFDTLMDEGSVEVACKAFRKFASIPVNKSNEVFISRASYACTLYLSLCMTRIDGPKVAVEMLRHGILNAIVNIAPSLPRLGPHHSDAPGVVKQILSLHFTKALCYSSVIREAKRCLDVLKGSKTDRKIKNSEIEKPWSAFRGLVAQRFYMQAAHRRFGVGYCHNCLKFARQRTLKYCAACRIATYCSELCQREAWRDGGHRETCAMLVNDREKQDDSLGSLSKSDESFALSFATRTAARNTKEIMQEINADTPKRHVSEYFVLLEFHTYPAICAPKPLDTLEERVKRYPTGINLTYMEELVKVAQKLKKTIAVCIFCRGDNARSFIHMLPFMLGERADRYSKPGVNSLIPTYDRVTGPCGGIAFEFESRSSYLRKLLEQLRDDEVFARRRFRKD